MAISFDLSHLNVCVAITCSWDGDMMKIFGEHEWWVSNNKTLWLYGSQSRSSSSSDDSKQFPDQKRPAYKQFVWAATEIFT